MSSDPTVKTPLCGTQERGVSYAPACLFSSPRFSCNEIAQSYTIHVHSTRCIQEVAHYVTP